jgi:hypothetical protein
MGPLIIALKLTKSCFTAEDTIDIQQTIDAIYTDAENNTIRF